MGGAVKSVGNILSAPANIINSIPVVGPIAGPAFSIATGDYLGAAGQIAGNAAMGSYSGGGGGGGGSSGGVPTYGSTDASGKLAAPTPGFNYGLTLILTVINLTMHLSILCKVIKASITFFLSWVICIAQKLKVHKVHQVLMRTKIYTVRWQVMN
jgi:hypothetical protein